jgi:tRNA threonylcarbamoyladenosine biosynthesis protein TsaE
LPINSTSSKDTEKIAEIIGRNLRGGEVIELASDLGGGKTVFARGLAHGAGSYDEVASPTFMISKVYNCPKFTIHHFDFYRLNDAGIVALELQEVLGDSKVVTVIEWAGIVENVLPASRMRVEIEQTGDESRQLKIYAPKEMTYLLTGLKK